MRRLPIFMVIDVSESMVGQPLRAMQEGIARLIHELRKDPYALETVYLSIIGFAGVAKTLAPLVELSAFYPPRLPIGAGTSIGAALHHVMDEISQHVVPASRDQKGDWKPVVYFLSDGSSTDNPAAAIARWQKDFSRRATLISIGIGPFADVSALNSISQQSFRLEQCDEKDFRQFIGWISQSIAAQSRSLGVDVPLKLDKEEHPALSLIKDLQEASAIDENYAILSGLCSKSRLPYLMKYERMPDIEDIPFFKNRTPSVYRFVGVYPVEADYAEWSDTRVNTHTIAASHLEGGGGCPHCGAACGLATCSCGQIMCVDGDGEVVCPGCQRTIQMGPAAEDFEIARSRG